MSAGTGPDAEHPTVVVGWDGSAASRAAVAAVARLIPGATCVAVHAHEAIAPHVTSRWKELLALDEVERSTALLKELPESSIPGLERLHLKPISVEGDPVSALIATAHDRDAQLIVVGSRGIGATTAATGSVSSALLAAADLPVLVIPPAAVVAGG